MISGTEKKSVLKILVGFFSLQLLIQGFDAASGFLIVRGLSKFDYSIYTLCNSIISSLVILSEMGAGSSIMSLGGKVHNDKIKLSLLFSSYRKIRNRLSVVSLFFLIPFVWYLFGSNHYSILVSVTGAIAIIVLFFINQLIQGYHSVLSLLSRYNYLQKVDFVVIIIKTLLLFLLFYYFHQYYIALLVTIFCAVLTFYLYRNLAAKHIDSNSGVSAEYYKSIFQNVKQQFVYYLYYVFQGQITFILIAFLGQPLMIADMGAIAKINIANSVLIAFFNNIVTPRIAKMQSKNEFRRFFLIIITGLTLYSFFFLISAYYGGELYLFVIGKKYENIISLLPLSAISGILSLYVSLLWSINYSRSWLGKTWVIMPLTIIAQVVFLMNWKLYDLQSLLLFQIMITMVSLVCNFNFFYNGYKKRW